MIKKDYIGRIYDKGIANKKEITDIVNELFIMMADDIKKGEKITISNFGTFEVKTSKPRDIYSPYDGKLIKGVGGRRISFKASPNLKDNNENHIG